MVSEYVSIFKGLLCQKRVADKLKIRKYEISIQALMGRTDAVLPARSFAVLMWKKALSLKGYVL